VAVARFPNVRPGALSLAHAANFFSSLRADVISWPFPARCGRDAGVRNSPPGASAGFYSLTSVVQWIDSLNSIRKQLRRISQGKGEKCTSSEDFIVHFSEEFRLKFVGRDAVVVGTRVAGRSPEY
jgi:hypothetical protein